MDASEDPNKARFGREPLSFHVAPTSPNARFPSSPQLRFRALVHACAASLNRRRDARDH
jgi:hypothetical protein